MYLNELIDQFKLNIKKVAGLTYITLNGKTTVLNDGSLDRLEYSLTDLNHAIMLARIHQQTEEHA